jgi:hypothetical protein
MKNIKNIFIVLTGLNFSVTSEQDPIKFYEIVDEFQGKIVPCFSQSSDNLLTKFQFIDNFF